MAIGMVYCRKSDFIVWRIAEREDVTENLKTANHMAWIGAIRNNAAAPPER